MTSTALVGSAASWAPLVPCAFQGITSAGSDSTFVMNGAADKMWFVFQATSTTPPDQIKFRCTAFTTLGTIDVTIETIDATTGFPSGTPVTNTNTASVAVASTGTKTVTALSGTGALVVGTSYAVVLTATVAFVGNFTLLRTTGTNGQLRMPYSGTKDSAGAHTKAATTNVGFAIGMLTSGGVGIYAAGFAGAYTAAFVTYGTATNPFERGNRFTFPVPVTISGLRIVMSNGTVPADTNSFSISLYTAHTSGAPVQQATQTFDGDVLGASAGGDLLFSVPYNLSANTTVALIVTATGATGPSVLRWQYAATAEVGCLLDPNFYATTRNGGTGAFTDTNTDVYAVFPLFSKLDDGASTGGGLLTHPGMGGGARG